jgi:hypothetical protein
MLSRALAVTTRAVMTDLHVRVGRLLPLGLGDDAVSVAARGRARIHRRRFGSLQGVNVAAHNALCHGASLPNIPCGALQHLALPVLVGITACREDDVNRLATATSCVSARVGLGSVHELFVDLVLLEGHPQVPFTQSSRNSDGGENGSEHGGESCGQGRISTLERRGAGARVTWPRRVVAYTTLCHPIRLWHAN